MQDFREDQFRADLAAFLAQIFGNWKSDRFKSLSYNQTVGQTASIFFPWSAFGSKWDHWKYKLVQNMLDIYSLSMCYQCNYFIIETRAQANASRLDMAEALT